MGYNIVHEFILIDILLQPIVVEIGCGVGNTLFPLVKNSPEKYFYAFDLSPKAIDVLKVKALSINS